MGFQVVSAGETLKHVHLVVDDTVVVDSGGTIAFGSASDAMITVSSGGTIHAVGLTSGTALVVEGVALGVSAQSGATVGVFGSSASMAAETVRDLIEGGGTEGLNGFATGLDTMIVSGGVERVGQFGGGVLSGGIVSAGGVAIVGADDPQYVSGSIGGLASGTKLGSGGVMVVASGGTAVDTRAAAGSLLVLTDGAVDSGLVKLAGATVVSTGVATIHADAGFVVGSAAAGDTLGAGDLQYVLGHGATTGTQVFAGGRQEVFSGGHASGTVLSGAEPNAIFGIQVVHGGGVVSGTVVRSEGVLSAAAGSVVMDAVLSSGGIAYATSARIVGAMVGKDGRVVAVSGSTVFDTTIARGGDVELDSGSIHRTVENGGFLLVGYEAESFDTQVNGGTFALYGSAVGTMLGDDAVATVARGASIVDTTLQSSADLVLTDAHDATRTTLLAGGTIDLAAFAYVSGATATLNGATDVLTISAGTRTVNLSLAGSYASASFVLTDDGVRGTDLTWSSGTPASLASLGAEIRSAGAAAVGRDLARPIASAAGAATRPVDAVVMGGGSLLATAASHAADLPHPR